MALASLLATTSARAEVEPAGAVQASLLASPEADFGGALVVDLWFPIDVFRIGGFLGVGVLPSAVDTLNRVMMPIGASLALEILGDQVGFSARVRGGMWGGATQEAKLTAGGFVGGGAYLLVALGGGTTLSIGMDVWGLIGDGQTALFAPGVGLTWNPTIDAQ